MMKFSSHLSAHTVLLLAFFLVPDAMGQTLTRYVTVDAANVRQKPNPKSEILFQLRLNLAVREIKRVNEWVNIDYRGIATGWMHQSCLGDSVATNEIPSRDRPSENEAYIALGFLGTTILLGKLDAKGDFLSLACPLLDSMAYTCDHFPKARPQAISAAGKRWFSVDGEVPEGAFLLAKKGPNRKWLAKISEDRMSSLSSYLEGFDIGVQWYELGHGDSNRIFSTRPIIKAKRDITVRSPLSVLSIPAQLFQHDSSLQLPPDHAITINPFYSIGLYEAISNFSYGDNGPKAGVYGDVFTGIFNENGRKIYPDVPAAPLYYPYESKVRFGTFGFFSFQDDENRFIYGLYIYKVIQPDGGVLHFDLIKISQKGDVKSFNIFQVYAGG